jgi:pimeloyl-ACP methyl ester carboxylesterase
MCDADVWMHQHSHLSDIARIVIPDLRGLDTLPAMAERVLSLAPQRFALAGHSMGGRVALEVWKRAPDRVTRLALLETGADPLAAGEIQKRQALMDLARTAGMTAVIETWVPPMLHPDSRRNRRLLHDITSMLIRTSTDDFIGQMRALINRPDASGYLKHILCPTLLLAGRHDTLYPVSGHEKMQQEIPGADLVIVELAGHFAPMENPASVTAALRKWMLQ